MASSVGVFGLKSQLERYSRPGVVTLAAGGSPGARNVLLIDAPCLEAALCARLGVAARADAAAFLSQLYVLAASYARGLTRTGLRLVVVRACACRHHRTRVRGCGMCRRRRRRARRRHPNRRRTSRDYARGPP